MLPGHWDKEAPTHFLRGWYNSCGLHSRDTENISGPSGGGQVELWPPKGNAGSPLQYLVGRKGSLAEESL